LFLVLFYFGFKINVVNFETKVKKEQKARNKINTVNFKIEQKTESKKEKKLKITKIEQLS